MRAIILALVLLITPSTAQEGGAGGGEGVPPPRKIPCSPESCGGDIIYPLQRPPSGTGGGASGTVDTDCDVTIIIRR